MISSEHQGLQFRCIACDDMTSNVIPLSNTELDDFIYGNNSQPFKETRSLINYQLRLLTLQASPFSGTNIHLFLHQLLSMNLRKFGYLPIGTIRDIQQFINGKYISFL